MTKTILSAGLSIVLALSSLSACEKSHDPCDSEGPEYSPVKCALGIDDRPVCTGEERPWNDCRKEVYSIREIGLELGIDEAAVGRLLANAGYPPIEAEDMSDTYWIDEDAMESLARLSASELTQ